MKYRKKPVVIDAIQWDGTNLEEIKKFVGQNLKYDIEDSERQAGKENPLGFMSIHTLEGEMECSVNDYIIKGVNGEFYPCKPLIFSKTYEEVKQ